MCRLKRLSAVIVALCTGACGSSSPGQAEAESPWHEARTVVTARRIAGPPAIIDMNADGALDLVVASAGETPGAPGQLLVFLGDGGGACRRHDRAIELPFPGRALWLACGDLNEDGHPDAVVGHHDHYTLAVYLGDGTGAVAPTPDHMVPTHDGDQPHTHSLALADVNADNHIDVLTTCADDNAVAVLLGDGRATFRQAPGSPFAVGDQPYEGLRVGCLDGDDLPDVAVADLWASSVTLLAGDGEGGFEHFPGSPIAVGNRPCFLALGDLNHDGHSDVVVTHDDDPVVDVLLGDGMGAFSAAEGSPVSIPQRAWEAVVADADGDGANDIVLGGSRDSIMVLRGDGRGGFGEEPIRVRMPRRGPGRVQLADLNGDGSLDCIVSYYDQDVIDVCFGR